MMARAHLSLVLLWTALAVACSRGPSQPAGALLEVRGDATLLGAAATRTAEVSGVAKVEKYLAIPDRDHAVIGVEPGAALRFIARGKVRSAEKIKVGRGFEPSDAAQKVAVLGLPAGDMSGMAAMQVPSDIGSSFELIPGLRVRVIGRFTLPREVAEHFVFIPLDVAQAAYERKGQVTQLFVTVDPRADVENVKRELRAALGAGLTVTQHE